MDVKEVEQLQIFVSDEKSAIQWVRLQLTAHPMGYGISTLIHESGSIAWEKHERPIELG